MVTSEREMVRELDDDSSDKPARQPERFTSLQPTYEDTVPPDPEDAWEYED
jgi:hypothetical protein